MIDGPPPISFPVRADRDVIAMHRLHCLPCEDSGDLAQRRRHELDLARELAAALGKSAAEAARSGFYVNTQGRRVDVGRAVEAACSAKRSIPPDAVLPAPDGVAFAAADRILRRSPRVMHGERCCCEPP